MDDHREVHDITDSETLGTELAALRAELDARGDRHDGRWAAQRHVIRRRLDAESEPVRPRLRLAWAAPALAACLLVAVLVAVAPEPEPAGVESVVSAGDLLRSVEATLAADPAAPLAPAGLLVAELEQEYAALQDDGEPDR